jgi:predicted unusual protein kinase regulating ubiquinone biosynthesis (AarF/ABC1/UbiB family)
MTGPRAPTREVGGPGERLRHLPRALGVPQLAQLSGWALAALAAAALSLPFERLSAHGAARRARRQERAVARLVAVLGGLKGVFAKAGQFAAIRHDVLPASWTGPLATLRSRVPPLPFPRIRASVERELGAPLATLFEDFEPEPLGAASIAQVHRARLPGGEPVAVKVQYPWLRSSLRADLAVARLLFSWLARGSRLDAGRVFAEFAEGVREELDFEREARVAREIAANLADDPQIRVPSVHASHSTRRVLTMSYYPAVPIDDLRGLARLGVEPQAAIEIVGRAYAKQVFADGLFHADPHPGNLFVLDEPTAHERPRVLFVDFGLSRRLDPALRREMRLGIQAVLRRDVAGFVAAMQRMEMIAPGCEAQVQRAVETMLERIGTDGALGAPGSAVLDLKDRAVALLRETPGVQLPNDLLLYAKTMSYVFGLGAELAPGLDLMKISLPPLLRFLGERD